MLNETEMQEIEKKARAFQFRADDAGRMSVHAIALIAMVNDLQRQVSELKPDAGRYRWLKENGGWPQPNDALIDSALNKDKTP